MKAVAAISAAFAGVAAAAATAKDLPTPFNGQIGLLHFPLRCKALGIPIVIDGVYTATGPTFVQEGQDAFFTDVSATITIPQYITKLAGVVKAVTADLLVFIAVDLTNATPNHYDVYPNGLWVNGSKLAANGDTTVRVPAKVPDVLPPVGPFKVGKAGNFINFDLGAVGGKLYLRKADGSLALPFAIDISCPVQDPLILLGIANIAPATGPQPPFNFQNGFVPDYPVLAPTEEYGCFLFAYQCSIPSVSGLPFYLKVCGAVFGGQKPGQQFSITKISATLSAGREVITAIKVLYPTATRIQGSVSEFNVTATNASPPELNVFKGKPLVLSANIPTSGNLTFEIPGGNATFDAPPFTAGKTLGAQMYIAITNALAQVTLFDTAGKSVGSQPLTCKPESDLKLIGVLITDKDFAVYKSKLFGKAKRNFARGLLDMGFDMGAMDMGIDMAAEDSA